MIWEGCGEF